MKKEVVASKRIKSQKRTSESEATGKKLEVPRQETKEVLIARPGKAERTLMLLVKILRSMLRFVEKKIQKLRAKRLAEKMDRDK